MFGISPGVSHRIWCTVNAVTMSLAIFASSTTSSEAEAGDLAHIYAKESSTPYIVRADRGGSVQKRLKDIYTLRITKRRVEIRGSTCLSSCTMLLGLPNTCVSPETVFGFHGPSRQGQPLSQQLFEQVTRIIAAQYPPEIQFWYLDQARYALTEMNMRTGAELIALSAATPCDPTDQPQLHAGQLKFEPDRGVRTDPTTSRTQLQVKALLPV